MKDRFWDILVYVLQTGQIKNGFPDSSIVLKSP